MKTVGNGVTTSPPFSTITFKLKNESENDKIGHENKHKLIEYQEFQKQTNPSEIILNTIGIRNIDLLDQVHNN